MYTITLLDIPISIVSQETIIPEIENLFKTKKQIQITTPNPEHLIQAQQNIEFKKALQASDISIPDGIGLIWGAKIKTLKSKIKTLFTKEGRQAKLSREIHYSNKSLIANDTSHKLQANKLIRLSGSDFTLQLIKYADQKNLKVGLLGSTKEARLTTIKKLTTRYNALKIIDLDAHTNIQRYSNQENQQIIKKINHEQPDILLVAYGAPFQELWIAKHLKEIPSVKIAIGVGGTFDFIAGIKKRAPKWMQNLGLEWLFRLIQEPSRWKRQTRLVKFAWEVIKK